MSKNEEMKITDGNEAAASIAHRLSEVVAIYPITPSSNMGEFSDAWAAAGVTNIWGKVPQVLEMQSEAGAIGACHGALQAGCCATTFTASQGLLLMIPNLYKIAGEMLPFTMHVAARTVAGQALSIFGDHSDVMACRQVGFAMLSSTNVQEAHDMALISHVASMKSRVPFMHFFDGFRTSHELNKIYYLSDDVLRRMVDGEDAYFLARNALNPDNPVIRGTAQNPDVHFQIKEAANKNFEKVYATVKETMKKFADITGRKYDLVQYHGAQDADRVIIIMGSGAETAEETVKYLNFKGEKVGVLTVHLYRPFPAYDVLSALPNTVKTLLVLDRTKELGAVGEPLYKDVLSALAEAGRSDIKVLGGRYGISSKEFTPAMVKAVFENRDKNYFTVGINDDVTHTSLPVDEKFNLDESNVTSAVFFGLGSDGTVGANKNSIKIIVEDGGFFGQAYFVYDSKKSGAMTASHLRFCKENSIRAPYIITTASFVACHHWPFITRVDMLKYAGDGAVFLINAPVDKDKVWDELPVYVQQQIIDKNIRLYAIDAAEVAEKTGMGRRINTIMQVCFFAISGVLPRDEAIAEIKKSIKKTYSRKGEEIVKNNFAAVDAALANLHEIKHGKVDSKINMLPGMPQSAADFLRNVTGKIVEGNGDSLPVSAFLPVADGTWPTATTMYEKRCIAVSLPVWDENLCIQCGKCAVVCPHAAVRTKVAEKLDGAPTGFKSADYKGKEFPGYKFAVQVAPEDCTGCALCSDVCPAKDKADPKRKALNMAPVETELEKQRPNFDYFLALPEVDRSKIKLDTIKNSQLLQPLFEFSGACAGCGETPYIKLVSQLFGDRMIVANATGCSSIYGGNLPTTPWCKNPQGQGPAWANSLFEDNAEFGLGLRYSADFLHEQARGLLKSLSGKIGDVLVKNLLDNPSRPLVDELKSKLNNENDDAARRLSVIADNLVPRSVWIMGGDGWAYDIGYGGLDHVLHSGRNVNILVMDTGVYSNTGGQQSKATPIGASAKFAMAGRELAKKDLGAIAMVSEKVYVASVAFGANDAQTLKAFNEAESYDGVSLILAYSHCIAHGFNISKALDHQKLAVETGLWPLYRFDPRLKQNDKPLLQLDSKPASRPVVEFLELEDRFRTVRDTNPERFNLLMQKNQQEINDRRKYYERLAGVSQ